MSDELDDALDEDCRRQRARRPGNLHGAAQPRVARLVSRVYGAAGLPLRARMLACLVRPLGSLGLVAVASGAFAPFLQRGGDRGAEISLDEVQRYSRHQVFELARFVEQVSPDAIQQVAGLLADSPLGAAAFSAAAALLLLRAVRGADAAVGEAGFPAIAENPLNGAAVDGR
jgi:hypothetical protein